MIDKKRKVGLCRDNVWTIIREKNIRTTWLNFFVRNMESFRWFFPISTYVMQSLSFKDYDVVISSSATVAKYIKVPNGKHICYCYIPTRALWQTNEYFGSGYKKRLIFSVSILLILVVVFFKVLPLQLSRYVSLWCLVAEGSVRQS